MNMVSLIEENLRLKKHLFTVWINYTFNKPFSSRAYLPSLLRLLGLNGKGAEVGVEFGFYSEIILRYSKLTTLYAIDPWKEFDQDFYCDPSNADQDEQDRRYEFVQERFKRYAKRIKILRMSSFEAQQTFHSGELDFVYIDANHAYLECINDLECWWPKLKKGGVFAGHDYTDDALLGFQVRKAVDEFADAHKQKLFLINGKPKSWYFVKNVPGP